MHAGTQPEPHQPASDWRSYDEIAQRYDAVWAVRFEAVARELWARLPLRAGQRVFDLGTGTGIVLRVRAQAAPAAGLLVGSDLSFGMLARARAQAPRLRVLMAEARALPFAGGSFDAATASFVLSHVGDYPAALREMARVLVEGGSIAVTNWAPSSDPYSAAWSACLAEEISAAEAERALGEVATVNDVRIFFEGNTAFEIPELAPIPLTAAI